MLDAAAEWKARPDGHPARPRRPRRGAAVREAVGPHAHVDARWRWSALGGHPIYLRPEEVGLDVRETGRRRRPHASPATARSSRRGCSTTRRSRGWRRRSTCRSSTCSPTARTQPGAGRPAHPARAVRRARRAPAGLRRRRQQRRRVARVRRRAHRASSSRSRRRRATSSTTHVVDRARNLGGTIELVGDPHEAVKGADAVYTDVWTSMGQEARGRRCACAAFAGLQVDDALMAVAGPDSVVPALPARAPGRGGHRGGASTARASVVWQQAANRMHAARAAVRSSCVAEPSSLMATLGKPQRQHRIARLLEEQVISSQAQLVELLAPKACSPPRPRSAATSRSSAR